MNEIPEIYYLENLEQLRAIADRFRCRIVETLAYEAMTAKQLANLLGEPPAKTHYHVRELERVGLVRLVETREKGGILEKYYRAVARRLNVPGTLLQSIPPDELRITLDATIEPVVREYLEATGTHSTIVQDVWLSDDEYIKVQERLQAVIEPYLGIRKGSDLKARTLMIMGYETPKSNDKDNEAGRTIIDGEVRYTRADLEEAVSHDRALDLDIRGNCTFDEDIPAELVDCAVSAFRHQGSLNASPKVREVLQRKGDTIPSESPA